MARLDDLGDVHQYIFEEYRRAIERFKDRSFLPYYEPTAVLRRIVYKVGCAYHRADKIELLRSQCEAARADSNTFSLIFQSIAPAFELSGLSPSNIRKFSAFMDLARSCDIHHIYLDHFVSQMGRWHGDAKRAAGIRTPSWVTGLSRSAKVRPKMS